ncbi:MAG TPA: sulfotransferase [Acidimicrobiales bacterium]|nr:sulfotransferase [Acidimicrobiales bacterium]
MLDADALVATAVGRAGSDDFGGTAWREGLDRLVEALNREADLTELGTGILGSRLEMLLTNRLKVTATCRAHPEIEGEEVEGPLVIIGLPRTGTTALSNLLAADPQIRSLRLWESSDPVPPPEAAHQHDDPRIEAAATGLELMYETFPRMRTLHFQSPTGPTECQDLLGMEFRTEHFDGMARVPSYVEWVVDCDMHGAYAMHRRVLQLLQWHCPPRLWHLKTPVHMLALDALVAAYPSARFLWTHRDPAAVLGSVCSLIAYTRSWVSDRDDAEELGRDQLALWAEAVRRALDFRQRAGESLFADIPFEDLRTRPVEALAGAYERLGLELGDGRAAVEAWARAHPPGAHGVHEFALYDFGLEAGEVRQRFDAYLERFAGLLERPGEG